MTTRIFIFLVLTSGILLVWYFFPVQDIIVILAPAILSLLGLLVGVVLLMLISPFFKGFLTNNPDHPAVPYIFTEATPNRTKLRMRGGVPAGFIRGGKAPVLADAPNLLWGLYEQYVYAFVGLYVVGVIFVHRLQDYDLARYRVIEDGGKKIFVPVKEGDPGYRSDHVRTEPTTWYFEFSGAEVQTVPFTVKGSAQIRIIEGREIDAFFMTDSWNVLLDQALNSVVRGVIRAEIQVDQLIGAVLQDIWEEPGEGEETYGVVQDKILDRLKKYKIGAKTLKQQVALEILKIDIIDFEPELSPEQLAKLMAPLLERQLARARALGGQGEAEFQSKVLAVAAAAGDAGVQSLWAQAMVKAAEAGLLDAAITSWIKKGIQS